MPAAPPAPPPSKSPASTPSPSPSAISQAPKPAAASPSSPPAAGKPVSQTSDDYTNEIYSDIDALDTKEKTPKAAAKPQAKKETQVKPPEGKEEASEELESKEEKAAPEALDIEKEPKSFLDLRNHSRSVVKELKELRPKLAQAEARIKELESNGDVKVWSERATAAEKRAQELDNEIQFVDYTKSSEFKDKYEKPYVEAWTRAVSDFKQLTVKLPDGVDETTGEPKFRSRTATQDDLIALANMPLSEMDDTAERMFGKSSPRVIRHVEKVRELAGAQEEALNNARKNAGERQKMTAAEKKMHQETGRKIWEKAHTELLTKYPKFFGPDESDPEGNALLDKGKIEADIVFGTPDAPEDKKPKTAEEAAALHARAYQKIKNHDRLALRDKRKSARIKELEEALKAYEDSEPASDSGGRPGENGDRASYFDNANAELDKLDVR